MTVPHLLHRVGREDADRVYCLVVNGIPLQSCHVKTDPSSKVVRVVMEPAPVEVVRAVDVIGAGPFSVTVLQIEVEEKGARLASTSKYR
jgi:hypothetical protein